MPIYIGLGTGEPYGRGPSKRKGRGRFRFYRYDIKDNFQLEYIRVNELQPHELRNVQDIPFETKIESDRATLVLGASVPNRARICLSDPNYRRRFQRWLAENPVNYMAFQQVELAQVHYDLRTQCPDIGFARDDVNAVLEYALVSSLVLCCVAASRTTDARRRRTLLLL